MRRFAQIATALGLVAGTLTLPPAVAPADAATATYVGVASTPGDGGQWTVTEDGRVAASGDAPVLGDLAGTRLNLPIVGIAATPTGKGYWLVASDGGIFTFGDAAFRGSTGAMRLNQPIVGMAATASGNGYWLVAGDGGIFTFGDATFRGSTGAMRLNQPIVGMAATRAGDGYWLVARDGGIFTFGGAPFLGSAGGTKLGGHVVGMATPGAGSGYWLAVSDGTVLGFGDATVGGRGAGPVTAVAGGKGYRLVRRDGVVSGFAGAAPAATAGTTRFHDAFDGAALDTTKWITCYPWKVTGGCTNAGNREQQWYLPSQVTVADGALRLTSERTTTLGDGTPFPFRSGMVSSAGKFEFTYGRVDFRARIPAGRGLWPALWMIPADWSWPPEIDVMEAKGEDPTWIYQTFHPNRSSSPAASTRGPDFSAGWHTFSVDWRPGSITWFVDGQERLRVTEGVPSKPMYLVMNLAVGGTMPLPPDATTPAQATFLIDDVRVST